VGEASTKLVEQLYGFDSIGLVSREQGVELLEGLMDSDFSARVSPEVGDRELRGVDGLINFIDALERDFEEFRYVADEIADAPGGRVVVWGRIVARGRASKMPLTSGSATSGACTRTGYCGWRPSWIGRRRSRRRECDRRTPPDPRSWFNSCEQAGGA